MFLESPELYDAIYHFKNYAHECEILRAVISVAAPGARTILDVACGTGEHARFLKPHYSIDGVDINGRYLEAARCKNPGCTFSRADMTDFDLGRRYDVVTCLFSAIGIVGTFERLERAVACMARHLKPDGLLIVEPWFTPDQWRPGKPFVLSGEIGGDRVYRLSSNFRRGRHSILLHHYLRSTRAGVELCSERIELALFTRDEMAWALASAGIAAQYDSAGLMGRGLYVGKFHPELQGASAGP